MARRYGRAPKGRRLRAAIPHGHWKTTTFVAGLRVTGMTAPLVFDGPINARVFEAYVEQFLAPALRPGDIVIMDNLSAEKTLAFHSKESMCVSADGRRRRLQNLRPGEYADPGLVSVRDPDGPGP